PTIMMIVDGVRLTKPKPNYYYRPISKPASGNGEASTLQTKDNKETSIPVHNGKTIPDLQNLNYVSLKNSFTALRNEENIFDATNVQRKKDDTFGSSNHDSDDEEVEEMLAPPKKTPRKTSIWSGRKADSPKRKVVFSLETKVHYFDMDDIDEVEHENAYSKKG
ncbi:hypothetical protein Tco_1486246, partial [Tanacetum coccineum]